MRERLAAAVFAALLTAGCAGFGTQNAPSLTSGPVTLAGAVELTPPRGLCVSPEASRLSNGFAMMGACVPGQGDPVVLSVQLGRPGSAAVNGQAATFAAFLKTEVGRKTLSASHNAATVTVISTRADAGQVRAHYRRHPEGEEWRGFTDVGDRLATVSLRSDVPGAITAAQGDRLLRRALAGLRPVDGP